MNDFLQTFIFDNTDIRGTIVKLDRSFSELITNQDYSDGQRQLLAQFVAANLLMSSHIKLDGLLSLQARGNHQVSMIMAECTRQLDFRGIIRGDAAVDARQFRQLFNGGVLAVTIEPAKGQRYQGIVPLDGDTLADCLTAYFEQSEQLPSRFYLASDGKQVTALMLQALPASQCLDNEQRQEDWQRIQYLAGTLTEQEMLSLPAEQLLYRLFHEETLRLFPARPVHFACSCSPERMERALLNLNPQELLEILDNDGQIETQCHFCNHHYVFQRSEILHLLQGGHSQ